MKNWKQEPPTKPGLYWVCGPATTGVELHKVYKGRDEDDKPALLVSSPSLDLPTMDECGDIPTPLCEFSGCLWIGPLKLSRPRKPGR
jgi:hypothetical protein